VYYTESGLTLGISTPGELTRPQYTVVTETTAPLKYETDYIKMG